MAYRIKDWDEHYETSESRKLVSLQWVKIPNQHDSLAYRLIAGHKKGAEIFAAWVLMVQVASRAKKGKRGIIALSPEELGIVTGFPPVIFENAIAFLKTAKIGWIEQSPDNLPSSPDASGFSPDNLPAEERTGENNTGDTGELFVAPRPEVLKPVFDVARKAYPGTKRGLDPEWANFWKHHRLIAAEAVPLILPAIESEKAHKAALKASGTFCPGWANFQTWINQSRWTQELSTEKGASNGTPHNTRAEQLNENARDFLREYGNHASEGAYREAMEADAHILPATGTGA